MGCDHGVIALLGCGYKLFLFTGIATIFHFLPTSFPLLSPRKWPLTMQANFGREVLFFGRFHVE